MASTYSYTVEGCCILPNAASSVHAAAAQQDISKLPLDNSIPRTVNQAIGRFTTAPSRQYTALTQENLRDHEDHHQSRSQPQSSFASTTYEYTTRTEQQADDMEAAHSYQSAIAPQMTPMEVFEATLPASLPYHPRQSYQQPSSPYNKTTRDSFVTSPPGKLFLASHPAIITSLHTEAGSADIYRLSNDTESYVAYPFVGIYGMSEHTSHALASLGAQFECDLVRDDQELNVE